MTRRFVNMPSFNGVAVGSTATLDCPTVDTYHKLMIEYREAGVLATRPNLEAAVLEIRLLVNGSVQRTFSAAQLNAINAFRGIGFDAGMIPIFFSEPWRRTPAGEDALAWHMGDVRTFQIEVDIDAAATTPTLSAVAVKETSSFAMGPIVQWKRGVVQVAGTGDLNYAGNGDLNSVYAYHAFEAAAADITDIEVKLDDRIEFTATNPQATAHYADHGFVMQAAVFSVAFDHTSRTSDSLELVRRNAGNAVIGAKALAVKFNMAVASNFTLLSETLGLRS